MFGDQNQKFERANGQSDAICDIDNPAIYPLIYAMMRRHIETTPRDYARVMTQPEQQAREGIDRLLHAAGALFYAVPQGTPSE